MWAMEPFSGETSRRRVSFSRMFVAARIRRGRSISRERNKARIQFSLVRLEGQNLHAKARQVQMVFCGWLQHLGAPVQGVEYGFPGRVGSVQAQRRLLGCFTGIGHYHGEEFTRRLLEDFATTSFGGPPWNAKPS